MKKILAFTTLVLFVFACSKDNGGSFTTDCSTAKSFANDVNPVMQSTCAISNCHAAGNNNGPGPLTTYQQVYNNRTAIRSSVVSGSMPKNGTLTAAQKNAIICWIENGAPNN